MIKAEYNKKTDEMEIHLEGEVNILLNEYLEITKDLFGNLSRITGEKEAKKIFKKAYKIGLNRAIEKEGKDNE